VIWATGYRYDFDWIDLPVFAVDGRPIHRRGVSDVPGAYFLGLQYLHKTKSSFLSGVSEDAAFLAEQIGAGSR
jgi:putative flavoprotein involved in K+ transport